MRLFSFVAFGALFFDQLSKLWIRRTLEEGESLPAIPGLFHLEHVHNHGAAWGVFSGQRWALVIFTLFVTGFMLFCAREIVSKGKGAALGFGLILGGALGNLIDRVWQGYVTDFVDFDTSWEWLRTFPVFNIADSALSVGVVVMVLSSILARSRHAPDSS